MFKPYAVINTLRKGICIKDASKNANYVCKCACVCVCVNDCSYFIRKNVFADGSVTHIKDVSVGYKTASHPGNIASPNCAAFNTICKDTSIKNVSKNVSCIFTDGMHSSYCDT